ncbi:cytochrome P450 [Gonapodya prolifera JEL478]|uniref:Cytochrome P450 n=1 Tax=Gonapodya prolifera (strain JEL478) TaxID=1344416 RepID=A0A139AHS7_GONPJ|nr:cytochrome P450 [Gonapodya prolifera JEL478]|eukprot:KXS16381.1 cytochrome P450 [Gonapodya prolifera JEL478]
MKNINEDVFGEGIFGADRDHWKWQRKVASNIFNVKNFREYYSPIFAEDAARVASHLQRASELGAYVDIQDLLLRSTMDSFLRIGMGTKPASLAGTPTVVKGKYTLPVDDFANAFDTANAIIAEQFLLPLWEIVQVFNGNAAKIRGCKQLLQTKAQAIMDKRRKVLAQGDVKLRGALPMDLLDYLIRSQNEDGTRQMMHPPQQLSFLFAGRDTTAQTLLWVMHEMAYHPKIFAKVREECLSVLGKDRMCAFEDIKDSSTHKRSSVRFSGTTTTCPSTLSSQIRNDVLPGTNTRVYKGQRVTYSPLAMGRLERIWGPDAGENDGLT